jgi:hypothetical protein
MEWIRYAAIDFLLTCLRVLPVPTRTGPRKIGEPGPNAPVFLTGDCLLTVERFKRALKGLDCYLLVAHREVVLPQLAAAGVERRVVRQSTGWKVLWGPVHAKDIREYMERGLRKSAAMWEVRFDVGQRLEMGVTLTFPFFLIFSAFSRVIWREALPDRKRMAVSRYTVFFDLSLSFIMGWGVFPVGRYSICGLHLNSSMAVYAQVGRGVSPLDVAVEP